MYLPAAAKVAARTILPLLPLGCSTTGPDTYAPEGPRPDDVIWKKGEQACLQLGDKSIPIRFEEDVMRKRMGALATRLDNNTLGNVPMDYVMTLEECGLDRP